METVMAGRKKVFPCGHRGKGRYCHRCKQDEERLSKRKEAKYAWKKQVLSLPLDLEQLPRDVVKKVMKVVEDLEKSGSYTDFKGKRLVHIGQREVISIPIGRSYRLICKDTGGSLEYLEVITHETYNNRLASGGWS